MIKKLVDYVINSTKATKDLSLLSDLLTTDACVGLILTERLMNIPLEVVPPMYKMLLEEISWALEEKEPYDFTHYLILSKTYKEVNSQLDQEMSKSQKKNAKKLKTDPHHQDQSSMFYFHPEDEALQRHSSIYGSFDYLKREAEGHSDSKRAFQDLGIKPQGHLILIEAAHFESAVKEVEEYVQQP